jgi:hypothetical protein
MRLRRLVLLDNGTPLAPVLGSKISNSWRWKRPHGEVVDS